MTRGLTALDPALPPDLAATDPLALASNVSTEPLDEFICRELMAA